MYNFNSILRKSSKSLLKNLIYSEYDAQSFYRLVKQYYETHPDASDDVVYRYFEDLFFKINYDIAKLPVVALKESTIEYNICRFLIGNEKERKEAYDRVIKEEQKGIDIFDEDNVGRYSSNILVSSRILTIKALRELRKTKSQYSEEDKKQIESFFLLPKKVQSAHKRTLSSKGRRDLEQLRELFEGSEFLQYSNVLRKCEPVLEHDLKEDYITSLMMLGNKFKQLGLLEKHFRQQERTLERIGIKGLTYPLSEDGDDTLSIESLFSRENLEKLSLNQLSMLNAFWLNRFTKELEAMNKFFFIAKELGLLGRIKQARQEGSMGYIRVAIDEEDLKSLYTKMNFLHEIANIVFRESKTGNYDTTIEDGVEDGREHSVKKIDVFPLLLDMEKDMGDEYKEYFSQMQPKLRHDIISDIENYTTMENAIHNTYKAKDYNIIAILSNLYQNGFSKNWGIMKEEQSKNSKMMLLGIDLEGLNMPIRLHIEKDLVCDFLRSHQNSTIFPIYEGEKDFHTEGRPFATQILMPLCGKQKKEIKTLMQKENFYRKNLIEHISFLADGNYPDHLKVETVINKKGKKKIVKQIPPRRYIDLVSGDEYVEDKNGELRKVNKENIVKIEGR